MCAHTATILLAILYVCLHTIVYGMLYLLNVCVIIDMRERFSSADAAVAMWLIYELIITNPEMRRKNKIKKVNDNTFCRL